MKNAPEGINNRLDDRRMHTDQENRIMEITQSKQQKEKQTLFLKLFFSINLFILIGG